MIELEDWVWKIEIINLRKIVVKRKFLYLEFF